MRTIGIAMAFAAGCVSTSAAQTITGRVVDADTNARLKAAEIMIVQIDSSARTITDTLGAFRVRAIPGIWTLRVQALGYQDLITPPMQIGEKEHLTIAVVMTVKPVEIAPIVVLGRSNRALSRLDEFHERKRRNAFGYFLDEKSIERMPAVFASDLLRRVPGAWVERNRVMMRGCEDALYLIDGMPITPLGDETATEAVNSMISPSDIAGIEVYRSDATVPMELKVHVMSGACGLVAIWTKR
jgi:hypothetical protein